MQIRWFGHSAFLLTSQAGTRVLIDPYDRLLRYKMPKPIDADIVAVTHNHGDHNKVRVASGDYLLVSEPRRYRRGDVTVEGFETYHDKVNGRKRGKNLIFQFTIDDLTVCHCGDLGHLLTEEQVRNIGKPDILMIPVGGHATLDGEDAAHVVKQLKPTITIPMHYRTRALSIPGMFLFDKVDDFLEAVGLPITKVETLDVDSSSLPNSPVVVIMKYQ
jgi:L-ascorbate metabolism protein UlaG (beta-lactamase superfamily)